MVKNIKKIKEIKRRETKVDLLTGLGVILAIVIGGPLIALIVLAIIYFSWGYKERTEIKKLKEEINYKQSKKPFKIGGIFTIILGLFLLIFSFINYIDWLFFIVSIIAIIIGIVLYRYS